MYSFVYLLYSTYLLSSLSLFGLVPSFSHFTVTQTPPAGSSCPTTVGYVVTASAPYNLVNYLFSLTLTATSKFSITCS